MPAVFLNRRGNSLMFDSIYDPTKHKLMVGYEHDGQKWTVSLYTTHDDVDCSEIAKSMGGGGHAKAAGFTVHSTYELFGHFSK